MTSYHGIHFVHFSYLDGPWYIWTLNDCFAIFSFLWYNKYFSMYVCIIQTKKYFGYYKWHFITRIWRKMTCHLLVSGKNNTKKYSAENGIFNIIYILNSENSQDYVLKKLNHNIKGKTVKNALLWSETPCPKFSCQACFLLYIAHLDNLKCYKSHQSFLLWKFNMFCNLSTILNIWKKMTWHLKCWNDQSITLQV